MASSKNKPQTVSIKTFHSWDFHLDFTIQDDGEKILMLQCNICSHHIAEIRREARSRGISGQVLKNILAYVDGVSYVHKANVRRHIQSGSLHDWAKRKFSDTTSETVTHLPITIGSTSTDNKKQNPIAQSFAKISKLHYRNHFNTALSIAMRESPMSEYKDLIELQKKNGVQFMVEGKDNDKTCREFISYLASAMRDDMKNILNCANLFSIEQDGTEPKKTMEEKELVYVKIVVRGRPIELFLKCQRMNDFGGADASCLKKSVDNAFDNYNLNGEKYIKCMISACADGAAVNMGKHSGVLSVMKNERNWLLIIHCSSHRLELAVKDAFTEIDDFQRIDDMMLNLYLLFKNSGKLWRILLIVANNLNVLVCKLPRSSGTRFQIHKYRAIKAMIINFLPLCLFAENIVQGQYKCKPEKKAKLQGFLRRWLDYGYLASMHLYRITLKETAHLSYITQQGTYLVTSLINAVKSTVDELNSIQNNDDIFPFSTSANEDGTVVTLTAEATNLPASIRFKEQNKLSTKQKKRAEKNVSVFKKEFQLKNVYRGKQAVTRIKSKLIPAIASNLETRLESFNDPIFCAFSIADHTQWDLGDPAYGKNHITNIAEHFAEPLSFHNFSKDMAIYEWQALLKLITTKFQHFTDSLMLWQQIFKYHFENFPHILLVIELVLVCAFSSSTVERGISTLNRELTSTRTSLKNSTLDDLLILRINLPILIKCDPAYEQKLVEKATCMYHQAKNRRKPKKRSIVVAAELNDNQDMFLPIPASSVIKPLETDPLGLLTNEDFLMNTDSDSDNELSEVEQDDSEIDSDIDNENQTSDSEKENI